MTPISNLYAHVGEIENKQPAGPLHRKMSKMFPMHNIWELLTNDDLTVRKWWGLRGKLEEKGVVFSAVYAGDFGFNTRGGTKTGSTYMGNLDLSLTFDSGKMNLWKGGTFFIYGIQNHGTEKLTGSFVGDVQGVSNIEAPRTTRLFELWYEQKWWDEKTALLFGLHDLNADFDVSQYAELFLNGSFGVQPTISGSFTAPIFPLSSLGVRLKWQPVKKISLQMGVFDGFPGDVNSDNQHGTKISLNKKSGILSILEAAYSYNLPCPVRHESFPGTVKVAGWLHDRNFADVARVDGDGNAVKHDDNHGVYVVFDQMILREKDDQGLGLFFEFSRVPEDRNTIQMYRGAGINYKGLIPGRDEDIFGVGVAQALISDNARAALAKEAYERTTEVTYRAQIAPSFVIQPDYQYVRNPNADATVEDAQVFILRFEISL